MGARELGIKGQEEGGMHQMHKPAQHTACTHSLHAQRDTQASEGCSTGWPPTAPLDHHS